MNIGRVKLSNLVQDEIEENPSFKRDLGYILSNYIKCSPNDLNIDIFCSGNNQEASAIHKTIKGEVLMVTKLDTKITDILFLNELKGE